MCRGIRRSGIPIPANLWEVLLIMFFDSAESKLFILLRHFDEVPQTFFELLRPVSRSVDKANPNPLVGCRKLLEMFPGFLVGFDLFQNILWDLELLFRNVSKRVAHLFDHFALFEELSQPLLVRRRIFAAGPAGREPLRTAFLIQ